jgi:formate dehydrogenase maturation protein FdhE
MRETWDARIERATRLSSVDEAVGPLLTFYAGLLGLQRDIANRLIAGGRERLTGSLADDRVLLRPGLPPFLEAIEHSGPELLAREARVLLNKPESARDDLLAECWRNPSDRQFFAKAVLQPYAEVLSAASITPVDRHLSKADNRCPFCGGMPQLSVRHSAGGSLEGGGRALLCATCLTVWPFRRVLCAHCGEEDEHKLGYFESPTFEHLRIDACESCRHYLKSVDFTKLGIAVPLVDEVAGASLDLWARDRGYQKIEMNLVGL